MSTLNRSQFDDHDERTGHARLLNNIRAAQLRDQPEPDHEPHQSTDTIKAFGSLMPVVSLDNWCCDWHRYHAQGEDAQ